MNIQQLIELLQECDPEAVVLLETGDVNLIEVSEVEKNEAMYAVILS